MTYMYQLMIRTCSHVPVYCVYQNTHTLLPSPPLLSSSQKHRSIPLHIAALKGHLDTVKRLMDGGSNINHQNNVRGKLVEPDYNNNGSSFSVFSSWLCKLIVMYKPNINSK